MFDWEEFRLLASDLLLQADNSEQKEAALRSVVSRAYYASFHVADDYLQKTGKYPSTLGNNAPAEGSHKRVIDVFIKNTANPTWVEIGKGLRRLKDARQWADYNSWDHTGIGEEFKNTRAIALRVKDAEKIIKLIKSL
jgi:uncharacterized protein (UPF0332 family)